ncbi:MAG TPA: cytochrome P450 [Caulobacteraceae bacterium]|jgi:cytochrome P450
MTLSPSLPAAERTPNRLDNPLKIDIAGAAFKRDPFPTLAAMRAAGPVIALKLPLLGRAWATTTHEATLAMVKDNDLFVQEGRHAGKPGLVGGMQWWMPKSLRPMTNNMLLKDEPDHRRLRKLVDRAFARRDVLTMRGPIEQIADRLLDQFEGRETVDLANDYARRLPMAVICDLLGVPDEDRDAFSGWTRSALTMKNAFGLFRAVGSIDKMIGYVRGQIGESRKAPRPGLIGDLVRDEEDGDKLDENELLSMVALLLVAGFETTTHLIGDSIIALEQNPEQKAWLLADPADRMERAVEELARYATPVQSTKPRYVARDAEFFGQSLHRGDLIIAYIAGANADPAQFDRPETLALDRFPNPHLVFSSGIHFCLGMQLARVEAQSALARLYARYPDLRIAPADQLDWIEQFGLRGVRSLPAQLSPVPSRLAA